MRRAGVICALALAGCAQAHGDYTEAVPGRPATASKKQVAKATVPLPSQALLTPQRKPDCDSDAAIAEKSERSPARVASREGAEQPASSDASAVITPPQPEANIDLALRIKLEYERECYRQAEIRVRARLEKLQASTSETVKAVKQQE